MIGTLFFPPQNLKSNLSISSPLLDLRVVPKDLPHIKSFRVRFR